jgi:hypothetical protein
MATKQMHLFFGQNGSFDVTSSVTARDERVSNASTVAVELFSLSIHLGGELRLRVAFSQRKSLGECVL